MQKIILIELVTIATIFSLNNYLRKTMGTEVETIFKVDEMGVSYNINGPTKGSLRRGRGTL